MRRLPRRLASVGASLGLAASACADPFFPAHADTELSAGASTNGGPFPADWIVTTTNDFSTGAVSIVETSTRSVRADLALASTDAVPFVVDDRVFVLNRFMFDYIDVLDPGDDLRLLNQVPIEGTLAGFDGGSNPHAIAFDPEGRAWIGLYGSPELLVYDLERPAEDARLTTLDLGQFADVDGIPEVDLMWAHGDRIVVALQRLDRTDGWRSVDADLLLLIDPAAETILDASPDDDGSLALALPGQWPKQRRADPLDEGASFLLNDGVLRIEDDPAGGLDTAWVVAPAAFSGVGIDDPTQPQSIAVSTDGAWIFVAAYTADFTEVRVHRCTREGDELTTIIDGLQAVERSMEIIDDTIWFGDTTAGAAGFRAFNLDGFRVGDSLTVGLPPYATASAR